jgi:drug/metabolite transporter (DMT)-like permease
MPDQLFRDVKNIVLHSPAADAERPPLLMVGACLAAVYIVWGTTYLAIKIGLEEVGPFFLLGTRLVVAGGALMLAMKAFGAPLPTPRQWAARAWFRCS